MTHANMFTIITESQALLQYYSLKDSLNSLFFNSDSISGIRMVARQYSGITQKHEAIIRDPTVCVNCKFLKSIKHISGWENLKVKVTKAEFTGTQCQEFDTPLVPLDKDVNTISTFSGSILGAQKASKSLACIGCHKRSVDVERNKAVCQSCDLSQIATPCPIFWSVRFLVKPDESSKNV